ncbi:MAG: hypothetical protein EOM37_01480 [Proteobacteria bacterium]|nr:hypothetical protein [Pseudomonadota bacterium]
MPILQSNLSRLQTIDELPQPANTDEDLAALTTDQKIVAWIFRLTSKSPAPNGTKHATTETILSPFERSRHFLTQRSKYTSDDWQAVANISGHSVQDFMDAGASLPLSAAEIDHFRRNHLETDRLVGRDFMIARSDLPSPLAELYGLYRHRARLDAEATLFVAQATGSTRVARVIADLLAIGAFASGHEYICHMSQTFSVPAAFDTSDLIDRTSDEALRRLSLSIETPSHLLKLHPDEISLLANNIVERYALSPNTFLAKANALAEARQDVHRIHVDRQLATSILEGDLPITESWVLRLCNAYKNIFPSWNLGLLKIVEGASIDADSTAS